MPVRPLPPALADKAKKELFEDPNRLNNDIRHIKDWIKKQPHLNARTDDQWIATFLRGCKFSLERTKEKIDIYYTMRKTAPEIFRIKHTDPIFEEIINLGCIVPLPKTAGPDAPRVALIRLGRLDPEKYDITDVISVSSILQKIPFMDDDHTVVAGMLSILDLEGVSIRHIKYLKPIIIKKIVVALQEAMPIRMKGTHYLNTPQVVEAIFNVVKSMLNEKNKDRLYVHNKNYQELYKYVPQEILPEEYGGKGGSIEEIISMLKQKVKDYSAFLEEDYQYGTDESKRPGKPRTSESMFGINGSFRRLDFD